MSKVETVADIELILLEMGQYVRDKLEKRDVQNTSDAVSGSAEAETDRSGNGEYD